MTAMTCALIGTGGHARVVVDVLQRMECDILFALTAKSFEQGDTIGGVPIVGHDSYLDDYSPGDLDLALGVGAPRLGDIRHSVWEKFAVRGFRQVTLVHPSAVIAPDVVLGEGAQIMAGAVIQPGCDIGSGAIVNTGARIDHECTIGPFAHVAPGATLCGNVAVGEQSLVGAAATLTPGVTIGANCRIDAGITISRDVKPGGHVHLARDQETTND
jgi:sugar O-acyltransferase (sialic acid O-acetyltransferase NeuD family)